MSRSQLVELLTLGGLLSYFSFVAVTKLLTGVSLTLIGAFLPQLKPKTDDAGGTTEIKIGTISVKIDGGIRFCLIVAGIVVLIWGISDGPQVSRIDARNFPTINDL